MRVFAGLGNPGSQYASNRHNVGFMAADAISRRHGFSPWTRKFQGLIADGSLGGEKVVLLKPLTFMNLSGQSVGELLHFYKLSPSDLSVLYDELDLPGGKVRVKVGGGHGGHNGIKSIDAHCGKDYRRVRIGIGHPGEKHLVHNYVLGDFAKADSAWLEPLLEAISEHAPLLAAGRDAEFMNKISLLSKPTPQPGPAPSPERPKSAKGVSHIRQARPAGPSAAVPATGPLADMLRKLLGKDRA